MSIYDYIYILGALIISMGCGFMAIPHIISYSWKHKLFDQPDIRKIHKTVVPRLGGIIFIPSMLMALCVVVIIMRLNAMSAELQFSVWSVVFFISLSIIYLLGVVDDIVGLGAQTKFIAQIIAVSLLPFIGNLYINNLYGFLGIYEIPFYIGAPLTVFVIVFICNAINLIDGIDGLSAGLSLIALGGFLVCFFISGLRFYCMLIAALMGVLVAFLRYNVGGNVQKHTKIFMGDSGSLTLGFILGFLIVKYSMYNPCVLPFRENSILLAYTMLIVPTFDVCRVVLVRIMHGQAIFKADKNHIHHKLMRAGLTQHQTLAAILAMAILFIVCNMVLESFCQITIIVCIDILLWFICHLYFNHRIKRQGNLTFVVSIREEEKKDKEL